MKCFHCHEDISKTINIHANIDGRSQAMCCHGCKAVAAFINEQGYREFYAYRGDAQPTSKAEIADVQWQQYDDEINFTAFSKKIAANIYTVSIRLEGIYCSACGWLIDKHLSGLDGIQDVRLNTITKILQVDLDLSKIKLSQILSAINSLGYHPILSQDSQTPELSERKNALKRLVLAGMAMMFIMTISVPLYTGEHTAMDPQISRFFSLVSLLVATIVYFYSGITFLQNAVRDLRNQHLGMDVPVALSITLAYSASVYNVLSNNGQTIYFDSMVMFIFFLLAGRYVEMTVRHQGMSAHDALGSMIPVSVKLVKGNKTTQVPYDTIVKGDVIQIDSGDVIASDGKIIAGTASINEAIITGEAKSIKKSVADTVMAGSLMETGEITIQATAIGNDTILANLSNLLEAAQMQKPRTLQLVDKIASWFVAIVLILASLTAIYYQIYHPEATMITVLAVLVATCPCALSLATPVALTAGSVKLSKKGFLINNLDAITKINKINYWFFDKTGTLTEPNMSLAKIHNYSQQTDTELLKIAAALEHQSSHPIASAFNDYFDKTILVTQLHEKANAGIHANIDNKQYRIGNKTFTQAKEAPNTERTVIYLSDETQTLAIFELDNQLRKGAKSLVKELQDKHKHITIVSGDKLPTVAKIAKLLGIKKYHAEYTPEQKINLIHQSQVQAKSTVMLGDGINDAPVLAQSDVSISFNQGTQMARAASDLIIMGHSLNNLKDLLKVSKKTNSIIKQNIIWALLYNLSVTPLAMMGYLTPWMAAIGMSLSSLLVVLNAKRILLK
ncbi:MAG: cadmium-translocating P-type ATPase [Proteobacteria bacterium]|nr:cadmium-translocating P-type ATPase [Pseudomonadota bacterium]